MTQGEVLRLIATDPAASIDVPHFCQESGHRLLGQSQDGETLQFEIERG